jgi:hypothetical protein
MSEGGKADEETGTCKYEIRKYPAINSTECGVVVQLRVLSDQVIREKPAKDLLLADLHFSSVRARPDGLND